jgi:hypothetical protein
VIIAIVYYLHDVPKYKRIHVKMDFCAHCIVNILQNVSQKRANKRITWNDLKFAILSGFSAVYPGKTMYCIKTNTHIYGHCPLAFVVCVKGESNGEASVLWQMMYSAQNNSSTSGNKNTGLRDNHDHSIIRCLKNVHPSQIYNGLEIKENEIKILVECSINGLVPGFLALNPKKGSNKCYFTKVVVFTPNPGLFDETPVSTHVDASTS